MSSFLRKHLSPHTWKPPPPEEQETIRSEEPQKTEEMDTQIYMKQEWAKVGGRAMMQFKALDADGTGTIDAEVRM